MNAELQRRIQRYGWDKAAPYYETGWEEQLWPAQEQLLELTFPRAGEKILDVSCGTGLVSLPLAELVMPNGRVTGIDISEKMIDKAKMRTSEDRIENISYIRMDAETLDFPESTFDKVVCSLGLMYFPNPDKALQEMYRVLKPGGQISALVWGDRKECGWSDIFSIVDKQVKSDVCPLFFQLGTGNSLQIAMEQVGFDDVLMKRFSTFLEFKDAEQACVSAFWGGAVALAYQKFDESTRKEVNYEYLASIEQYQNGNGYAVPGEFVLVKGKK